MVIDTKEVIDIIGTTELEALKIVDSQYTRGIISYFSQLLIQRFEDYAEKEMSQIAKENKQ